MNNLLFEKIWEDADFYQIIVKALAKNISAETKDNCFVGINQKFD